MSLLFQAAPVSSPAQARTLWVAQAGRSLHTGAGSQHPDPQTGWVRDRLPGFPGVPERGGAETLVSAPEYMVSNRRQEERPWELGAPELAPPVLALPSAPSGAQLQEPAAALKNGICFLSSRTQELQLVPSRARAVGGARPLCCWGGEAGTRIAAAVLQVTPRSSLSVGVCGEIKSVTKCIFLSFGLMQFISRWV